MNLTDQIFAQALLLAGQLDDRQQALLRVLCRGAECSLTARLREDVQELGNDFVLAASLYALAALMESGELNGVESFTVGDVSVRKSGGTNRADTLRRQAEQMLKGYSKDGFSFQGV